MWLVISSFFAGASFCLGALSIYHAINKKDDQVVLTFAAFTLLQMLFVWTAPNKIHEVDVTEFCTVEDGKIYHLHTGLQIEEVDFETIWLVTSTKKFLFVDGASIVYLKVDHKN